MPIYEYECEKCGEVTEVLRPMSQADAPLACESCGSKKTHRRQSEFAAGGAKGHSHTHAPGGSCGCCGGNGMCGLN